MTKTYNANLHYKYTEKRLPPGPNCSLCLFMDRSGYGCDDKECSLLGEDLYKYGVYKEEACHPDCPLEGGKSVTVKWEK